MLENKHTTHTPLETLGEFGLVEHLSKHFKTNNNTLVSNNIMIEGVHFDLGYFPLKHLGYKAVVVPLADICAKNGTAQQIAISIAVSNRFSLEAIEELFEGIRLASSFYNLELVDCKTTSSVKGLIIGSTVIGKAKKSEITNINSAKDTNLIVLTGDIGAAYMGLQVLEREKQVFLVNPQNQPDLEPYSYLIERQLKPEARADIKKLLEDLEVKPTAMVNIASGLSTELMKLCKKSKVGCNLYEGKLPLDPQFINACEEFNIDSTTIAINGGEDYELLFTINIKDYDKIKGNPNFTVIGHIVPENEGMHLITRENTKIALKARGIN